MPLLTPNPGDATDNSHYSISNINNAIITNEEAEKDDSDDDRLQRRVYIIVHELVVATLFK